MGWMSKLIARHNGKEKCLVCEKKVPKDAAVVNYTHMNGRSQAFLCHSCEEKFSKSNVDFDDDIAI